MPQLKIKSITNREFTYSYEEGDSVLALKESINNRTGTGIDQFKLIFDGQTLEDNKKLVEYGVVPGVTIRMMLSFKGG